MNKEMEVKLEKYLEYFEQDKEKALLAVVAEALCEISRNTENIVLKIWE